MATVTNTVILRESVLGSVVKDAVTFAMFAGIMYFNHAYLAGNGWLDAIFVICILLWLASLNSSRVFKGTAQDAIKWLEDKENVGKD